MTQVSLTLMTQSGERRSYPRKLVIRFGEQVRQIEVYQDDITAVSSRASQT
jgi:hypothetical protein